MLCIKKIKHVTMENSHVMIYAINCVIEKKIFNLLSYAMCHTLYHIHVCIFISNKVYFLIIKSICVRIYDEQNLITEQTL